MSLDFLGNLERTHLCGELRAADAGQQVVLMGWVNRRRDHGNLIFLDLRDRSGIAQIVLDKELTPDGHAKGEQVRPEYVVAAVGKVRLRAPDAINPKMETGEIEIEATELLVLNDTRLAPFSPSEEAIQNEEVRLKYRYIDLRRPEMQHNFRLRHDITLAIRDKPQPAGLSGDRDAHPHQVHARGRARFSGAQPRASRRVLRAAAVAADLQADPHDLRLRPLLPDRALLPRRGPARRPPA